MITTVIRTIGVGIVLAIVLSVTYAFYKLDKNLTKCKDDIRKKDAIIQKYESQQQSSSFELDWLNNYCSIINTGVEDEEINNTSGTITF